MDEVYRWLLRTLVEGNITPTLTPTAAGAGAGPSNSSPSWKQVICAHTVLPSPSVITTLPPAPKLRDALYRVLSVLVSHRIHNAHTLTQYLAQHAAAGGATPSTSIPLLSALRGLVRPEYQRLYDSYWNQLIGV